MLNVTPTRTLKGLTERTPAPTLLPMEIHLNPDVHAKLARIASERGRDAETLAQEAIEQYVDHDEWLAQEVEKGIAAADRGEFVEHEDVRKLIDSRYPG